MNMNNINKQDFKQYVKIEESCDNLIGVIKEEALSIETMVEDSVKDMDMDIKENPKNKNKNMNEYIDLKGNSILDSSKNISKKKRRLKGQELINTILEDPVFRQHHELLDRRLDDISRKRMMQKIRNRISAQESRDRRKVYITELEYENLKLREENDFLKKKILKVENELLKKNNENSTKVGESNCSNSNNSDTNEAYNNKSPSIEKIEVEQNIYRARHTSPTLNWKAGS